MLNEVKLVNIDLKGINYNQQLIKIEEEDKEFLEAIESNDDKHKIEEFWDSVQARLGLLDMDGISAERVMQGYPEHLNKLKNRPRTK
ncbi:MAG: hypothetical protein RSA29_17065 [Clostridium sp.]|uniref:hypothetical protein n=1 Tax=Clostridium sp. TaxID=1506 RepID=UPI00305DDFE6